MEWHDAGLVISLKRFGETSCIADIFTRERGRHGGLVKGALSKRRGGLAQPGDLVRATWRARLGEHLGNYTLEMEEARAARVLSDSTRLRALSAILALIQAGLAERQPAAVLFERTDALIAALADAEPNWVARYALWECDMLQALGFGLDFSRCASGSADMDLVYVSPRSGRAVSRSAGQPYADKLLPLPCFLKSRSLEATGSEVLKALKTTGYFLDHKVFQSTDQIVPAARERLVSALVTERQGSASSTDSAEAAPR